MKSLNSRAKRRNRTCEDLGIKNEGGMLDLVDNAVKESFRINDDEYDFLAKNITKKESEIILSQNLSFTQKRECLLIVEKHLTNYYNLKNSR